MLLVRLSSAIERHTIDHGFYPIHLGPPELGRAALYEALISTDKNYMDPRIALENSKLIEGKRTFVDQWGEPIHYRCDGPSVLPKDRKTINPTYDLWSKAGEQGDSTSDRANWLTNWYWNSN